MRIRKTTTCIRKCVLAVCVTALSFVAAAAGVVTVSSPGPGQLQLTPEALIATHLKVTGYVDARDFGTLKAATMTATQELDVSPCLWLRTLSCNMNQLTELDLTENMDLKYLYCEYNRIRRLAFAPEAKLFELGCTGNSFGFSQIPDRMQAAVVNGSIGDDTPVSLWYQPPFDPGTGDLLDLSGELFSADGHPVVISLARDGTEMPPLGGLYAITETGWYSVEMTCTDMPLFTFWGEFYVSGPSAAGRLPLDGVEIGISGLRVNVGGLPEGSRAALFSAAGAHVDVAVGSTPSLAARQPGVYILRLTDGAGRTQAVKLRLE